MWGLLPRTVQVLIVVFIGVMGTSGICALHSLINKEDVQPYQFIAMVASITTLILIPLGEKVWRWFWRVTPLGHWIFPDLSGTWKGELISTWENPETDESPPPIPVIFWIKQGLFSTSVSMKTGESRSFSTRCFPEADRRARVFRFWYGYDNRPDAEIGHRSARHEGAAWLELDMGTHPDQLLGQYFTQRKTSGDIRIRQISRDMLSADDRRLK